MEVHSPIFGRPGGMCGAAWGGKEGTSPSKFARICQRCHRIPEFWRIWQLGEFGRDEFGELGKKRFGEFGSLESLAIWASDLAVRPRTPSRVAGGLSRSAHSASPTKRLGCLEEWMGRGSVRLEKDIL